MEDRKAIRTVVLITAVSLLFIDRSCLLESLSRSWGTFDENKRSGGPLGYGSNQTAAYSAQFAMFFWGVVQFVKKRKYKMIRYGLIAIMIFEPTANVPAALTPQFLSAFSSSEY